MRLSRRLASTTVAVALVLPLSYEAAAHAPAEVPAAKEPFGAECRIRVTGSEVTASCHNPYPRTDRVRLHVECARWWDLDTDGRPVPAEPAQTVRLAGRCWKEVDSAWISHHRDR
ncbi:hypothetical protein F8R89_08210 [Streptomyces sp. SS1-1]|uniref:hypothetical protein n=1 Tax=Streptomyces sp. SS1-1 TaxID=2651869 RepID=UPI0012508B89|nr:hypothetical protein [Streptomyces sp. SS1-1]KAB2972024.1 hypothetical protein F8R89_08210 [Streptomyces sp. SS1-1]